MTVAGMLMPTWMVIADAFVRGPRTRRCRARPLAADAARLDGRAVGRNPRPGLRTGGRPGAAVRDRCANQATRRRTVFVAVTRRSNLAQVRVRERRAMERSRDPGLDCPGHSLVVENFCGGWNMTSLARAVLMPSGV